MLEYKTDLGHVTVETKREYVDATNLLHPKEDREEMRILEEKNLVFGTYVVVLKKDENDLTQCKYDLTADNERDALEILLTKDLDSWEEELINSLPSYDFGDLVEYSFGDIRPIFGLGIVIHAERDNYTVFNGEKDMGVKTLTEKEIKVIVRRDEKTIRAATKINELYGEKISESELPFVFLKSE